ncbi:MAG: family 20 glycosylhydrolase [Phycisphaeraceae bacterium]|nr:family 20 glycosylhydrolase [Phycisphaeraceae bacterium]
MPTFKHRVVMLDPARQMDTLAEFEFLLPWLARWGYNTLHWHFADDEGCRLVLPSHPELAGRGALTSQQMRRFIGQAGQLGIDVLPELESLGHTRFITRHAQFRGLGSSPRSGFNALDPDQEAIYPLLKDLLADVAEIFPAEVLHVGLDEVNFKSLPGREKITPEDAAGLFARHAVRIHEIVRRLGKRPAMWGDHLLHSAKSLEAMGKDVLVFDWHYEPQVVPDSLDTFTRAGFETWACPATMCWLARVVSNSGTFTNVRRMTAYAMQRRRGRGLPGVSGMVNTVWCPYRYLPGAMDYAIAWAGHLFDSDEEDADFGRRFAVDFYGHNACDAKAYASAIDELHAAALTNQDYDPIVTGRHGSITFHREHVRMGAVLAQRCKAIAAELRPLIRRARRNAERLNDVLLSTEVLERVGRFAASGRRKRSLPSADALSRACRKAWARSRVNDPAGNNVQKAPAQKLLAVLRRVV